MNDRPSLLAAEFTSADALKAAAARLRDIGISRLEGCSPYEIRGLPETLGLRRSRLPAVGFVAGAIGAAIGYLVQWYVDAVDYPLDAGGRPPHAIPSFIFVTFETMVLFASVAIFIGFFVSLRLPRYYHPIWHVHGFERASVDRFWIVVDARDEHFDRAACENAIAPLGPLRIVDVEVGE